MSDPINLFDMTPPAESPVVAIFNPPMCCSSGLCGPTVDQTLVDASEILLALQAEGLRVERYQMTTAPQAFLGNTEVMRLVREQEMAALPITVVRGKVVKVGAYPSLNELRAALNGQGDVPRSEADHGASAAAPTPTLFTAAVSELVAIGAAIASNCEPCFKYHYDQARKLGVAREDMLRAVRVAQNVKETPARAVLELAERYLGPDAAPGMSQPSPVATGARATCCEPVNSATATRQTKCC